MAWRAVVCCGWLVPLAGCTLFEATVRNLHHDPQIVLGEKNIEHWLRRQAREALAECSQRHPKKVFSKEFVHGFSDGFVDYLDRGGPCAPPAVPPFRYRKNDYLSPEGHARVRDYFAGFQYGVDVAVATGWRQYLTVPVQAPEKGPPPTLDISTIALPAPPDGLSTDPPAPALPVAPPPRPVPDSPKAAAPGERLPAPAAVIAPVTRPIPVNSLPPTTPGGKP
jgi:hypothetical protein